MDIHLPELTGVEATRRIRHENEDIRVLVLTAYDDPAHVYALLDAGADGFVLKTAELSELSLCGEPDLAYLSGSPTEGIFTLA